MWFRQAPSVAGACENNLLKAFLGSRSGSLGIETLPFGNHKLAGPSREHGTGLHMKPEFRLYQKQMLKKRRNQ